MKKRERQALCNYVRAMADMLWMRDWDFDVFFDADQHQPERQLPDAQEWGASVEQSRHRQHATIHLPSDFRTNLAYEGIQGKQTIAHELIHMHMARCWDQVRVDLLNIEGVSQGIYDIFVANFERNLEYGIDALAYAFAESMPDIDWSFTEKKK